MSVHGWKTYLAAAAAILTGAVAITQGQVQVGISGIIAGMALIGVRGAAAKIITALQEVASLLNNKN